MSQPEYVGQSDATETPERVFEELLIQHLDQQRQRWRNLDIEGSLYVQGQDWMTRYRKAVGAPQTPSRGLAERPLCESQSADREPPSRGRSETS